MKGIPFTSLSHRVLRTRDSSKTPLIDQLRTTVDVLGTLSELDTRVGTGKAIETRTISEHKEQYGSYPTMRQLAAQDPEKT